MARKLGLGPAEDESQLVPGYGYGWKYLNITDDARLKSPSQGTTWTPEGIEAQDLPSMQNTVGIYVTANAADPELANYGGLNGAYSALVQCQIWGKCVQHRNGYRAQFARPYVVYVGPAAKRIVGALRKNYQCDVEIVDFAGGKRPGPYIRNAADADAWRRGEHPHQVWQGGEASHPDRPDLAQAWENSKGRGDPLPKVIGGTWQQPIDISNLPKRQGEHDVSVPAGSVAAVPSGSDLTVHVGLGGGLILHGGSAITKNDAVVHAYPGTSVTLADNATLHAYGPIFDIDAYNKMWHTLSNKADRILRNSPETKAYRASQRCPEHGAWPAKGCPSCEAHQQLFDAYKEVYNKTQDDARAEVQQAFPLRKDSIAIDRKGKYTGQIVEEDPASAYLKDALQSGQLDPETSQHLENLLRKHKYLANNRGATRDVHGRLRDAMWSHAKM